MAVSCGRNITLWRALEPSQHFELSSSILEFIYVWNSSFFIKLDFTLALINLLMKSNKNKCIIEAVLVFVDATVHKHLVSINEDSCMTFACLRQMSWVIYAFKFCPYLVRNWELIQIIVRFAVATSTEDEQLIKETYAWMGISCLWCFSLDSAPLEQIFLLRVKLQQTLMEGVKVVRTIAFAICSTKDVHLVVDDCTWVPISFLRELDSYHLFLL